MYTEQSLFPVNTWANLSYLCIQNDYKKGPPKAQTIFPQTMMQQILLTAQFHRLLPGTIGNLQTIECEYPTYFQNRISDHEQKTVG